MSIELHPRRRAREKRVPATSPATSPTLVPGVTRDPGLAKDLAVMHLRDLAATTTIAMYLAREIRDRKGTVANEVIVLRS